MKQNILIRKAKVGDEKGIVNLMEEGLRRKNWLYTGSNRLSKDKLKKIREEFKLRSPSSYSFIAIDKLRDKIVCSVFFSFKKSGRTRHRIDFGWGVHPDYQKQGIATKVLKEALEFAKKKGFKRAEAEAAVINKGSIKLAEKCGFKIEGRKKQGLLLDNEKYADTYILGRTL